MKAHWIPESLYPCVVKGRKRLMLSAQMIHASRPHQRALPIKTPFNLSVAQCSRPLRLTGADRFTPFDLFQGFLNVKQSYRNAAMPPPIAPMNAAANLCPSGLTAAKPNAATDIHHKILWGFFRTSSGRNRSGSKSDSLTFFSAKSYPQSQRTAFGGFTKLHSGQFRTGDFRTASAAFFCSTSLR